MALSKTVTLPTPKRKSLCLNGCCGAMRPVYAANSVPTHSCLLLSNREEAIQFPRGSITLAFCDRCGFISNLDFDPALSDYSIEYEESQHFSPRFTQYAESLVNRLVSEYKLRGKTILEIGCGKGDFLAMLCKAGDNQGIGMDPACRPERQTDQRITFIRDLYSEAYRHLSADMICCRHTLEHIQPTFDFLRMIRNAIGERKETLVFFEVPDVRRILREHAFWDIYYEHCSYFSAGSLARLFRKCGFEVLELVRDFSDQYLWLTARPCQDPPTLSMALEDDLEELTEDVSMFRDAHTESIDTWKQQLAHSYRDGCRSVVWGASSKCVAFFSTLNCGDNFDYVVDINPHKHGKFLPGSGHEIVSPDFLTEYDPELVVVMNPIYVDEITADLHQRGVHAEVIAL